MAHDPSADDYLILAEQIDGDAFDPEGDDVLTEDESPEDGPVRMVEAHEIEYDGDAYSKDFVRDVIAPWTRVESTNTVFRISEVPGEGEAKAWDFVSRRLGAGGNRR